MSAIVNSGYTLRVGPNAAGPQHHPYHSNHHQQQQHSNRNKYNTLTLAEAKRLDRYLNGRRPTRTASVLNKPRAPPTIQPHHHQQQGGDIYGSSIAQNIYSTPPKSNNSSPTDSSRLQASSRTLNGSSSYSSSESDNCKFKSASKLSLASSTSKALKDQFSNIKKFFRLNQRPINGNNTNQSSSSDEDRKSLPPAPPPRYANGSGGYCSSNHSQSPQSCGGGDQTDSLFEYISDLSLMNRSQSPPVCPPPPAEFKSMLYMESNLDAYSNYDDFTNSRNKRTSALLMKNAHRNAKNSLDDDDDQDSWMMTSLPVAYERNMTNNFLFSQNQQQQQQHNNYASCGLPPRIPAYEQPSSKAAPTTPTTPTTTTSATTDYGNVGGSELSLDNDDDCDTTLLSDTSTLHGDSSQSAIGNKCAELERTIESLKDKLIGKEKELTDLQLKQWSSDYLIDQLKSTISRLEKENAQLKKNVLIYKQ